MNEGANRGLYGKYDVYKANSGIRVPNCFVLRPDRDPHALVALKTYASVCYEDNQRLANDLNDWITKIEAEQQVLYAASIRRGHTTHELLGMAHASLVKHIQELEQQVEELSERK